MDSSFGLSWPFFLRQLAVMLEAGIPIDAALKSLEAKLAKPNSKLMRAKGLVERGVSLPDAFRRSQMIDEFDYGMLVAADSAGHLANGLNHISERRVNQLQRVASLKAALVFPKAIMLIGALAGVFIRTSSGSQSVTEACLSAGVVVVWFYLIAYLAMLIIRADTRIWMSWFWPYPILQRCSKWYRLALEYLFFNSFTWQIQGGVSAGFAAKSCSQLLRSRYFRRSVMLASGAMSNGESITLALSNNGLIFTDRMRQVLLIADQSGTHEQAIKHELKLQAIELAQKADNFFKWTPRVFYVMALTFVSPLIVA